MPQNINYSPVIELISPPRIRGFSNSFGIDESNQCELYGVYVWSQNASASLYPLMQQLEILIRNSIDKEARRRFNDFWWDTVSVDHTRDNWNNFKNGINKAQKDLEKKWKKAERARLNLSSTDTLPATSVVPSFSHDDIVAATDFGTWMFVLIDAYSSSLPTEMNNYLWPKSMSKVFRKYDIFSNTPDQARREILNAINVIREYRNRLFHHDCMWVKARSSDRVSAIDSIRNKINLIEKLITCISPITMSTLNTWGIFSNSRRVCSVKELELYINVEHNFIFSAGEEALFNRLSSPAFDGTRTVPIGLADKTMAIYRLR